MKVLVVGYGSAGARHAALAASLNHRVAVADLRPGRRASAEGAGHEVLPLDDGAVDDVSAVVIATPAATHFEVARLLQRRGYRGPLFVEKPLDVTVGNEEFWRSWPSATTCVGYNWRFLAKDRDGVFGRARLARFACLTDMSTWPGQGYASPVLECSHEIDLALRVLGESGDRVDVVRATRTDRDWSVSLMAGDRVAQVAAWFDAPFPSRTMGLVDDKGVEVGGYRLDPDSAQGIVSLRASYLGQMKAFLAAASRSREVRGAASFGDGLRVIEVADRIEASRGVS